MNIEPQAWDMSQTIPDLYLKQFQRVASRFEYNPWESDVLKRRVEDLDHMQSIRADRNKLADCLASYNQSVGSGDVTMKNIEKLRDASTLTVIGGQQAGLFTGPILVIYKALTVIQQSRQARAFLQREVVPIFWIAGEDHDFNEVNHTYCLTKERTYSKIELQHTGNEKSPVSQISFTMEHWESVLQQLDEALMPTEFKSELMQKLKDFALQSSTLTDLFARIMAWLFQDFGLILIDSHLSSVRALESPFFEMLIRKHQALNNAFLFGVEQLEKMGFEPQATVQEQGVNLFKIHEEQRLLLLRDNERFYDKNQSYSWTEQELLCIAKQHPEQLSNNVLTRPLMQEYLFPVLATVLGPGEIAYWALLKEGFQEMGMKLPIVLPRIQMTLIEGTVQKQMEKFGWELRQVMNEFETMKKQWLEEQDTLELDEKFEQVKQQFVRMYQPVLDTAASVHPGMKNLGETNKQKIVEQIEFMRKRAASAFEQQFQASIRQMDRMQQSIMPMGKPQERVYNIFMYLNKYGNDWLNELIDTPLSVQTGKYSIYF